MSRDTHLLRRIEADRVATAERLRPTGRRQVSDEARNGATLLELLVVLVLMAISAALVLPALSNTTAGTLIERDDAVEGAAIGTQGASPLIADAAVDPVLTTARRLAIKRGEPVRLRLAHDGVWAVVSLRDGAAIADGRIATPLRWLPDVVVDALGTCVLSTGVIAPAAALSWDVLACRWRGVQ